MMRKCFIIITIIILGVLKSFAQTLTLKELEAEVLHLINSKKYEKAFSLTENVIYNNESTNIELFDAYFLKYLIYKSLLNYTKATESLNSAEKYGLKSKEYDKAEFRIEMERIFIAYDLSKIDELSIRLKNIDNSKFDYLEKHSYAFYLSILSAEALRREDKITALSYLDSAENILLKHNLMHLPLIYRKKMDIYRESKEESSLISAYNKGIYYAEIYNVDIYKLNLYEALFNYYHEIKNFEKLYEIQLKINELHIKLNLNSFNHNLINIESQKKISALELEQKIYKTVVYLLGIILLIISFIGFRLKKRNTELQISNEEITNQLEKNKFLTLTKKQILDTPGKINYQQYPLSERQLEIIDLIRLGKTNKQIAEELNISENTVKYHLKNIFQILDIENRTDLQ